MTPYCLKTVSDLHQKEIPNCSVLLFYYQFPLASTECGRSGELRYYKLTLKINNQNMFIQCSISVAEWSKKKYQSREITLTEL